MRHYNITITFRDSDSRIMQNSIPAKMLIACFFSCIIGIILMALLAHYLMIAAFVCILICICITAPLFAAGKISINTACLVPMSLLCFVYTPLSWFTFDGLLGCTPYLSILFAAIIALTYYRRIQAIMLALYGAMMLALIVIWLITWPGEKLSEQIINILVAYLLTAALIVFTIEGVKQKNMELNKKITDLSLRDALTGLLNRRAIDQILGRLEGVFKSEGAEYALIILDIDKFKSINDLFGHSVGDSVINSIATSIQTSIRTEDHAFRYGGDEFLLLLPYVNSDTAYQICDRIDAALREVEGYAFPLTVSKGCALRSEVSSTAKMFELADERMYEDKRNRSSDEAL